MPTIPVYNLDSFRSGTTDYAAGRARQAGRWLLVRKQYGNNSAAYSYALFGTKTDYLAARANPDGAAWQEDPYSEFDYTLLLLPLATPLPASTDSVGATSAADPPATDASMHALAQLLQRLVDAGPARNADGSLQLRTQDNEQPIYVRVARATTPPTLAENAASETTLAKVLAQLTSTLRVGVDGAITIANFPAGFQVAGNVTVGNFPAGFIAHVDNFPASQAVTGKFWQDTQPVSGPATNAELRATALPVSLAAIPLAAGAATSQGQADQLAKLTAIDAKLGGALTFTIPTGAATSQAQLVGNASLAALEAGQKIGSTAALQTDLNGKVALASKQDVGNASLASLDTKSPPLVGGRVPVDIGTTALTASVAPKATGGTVAGVLLSTAGANATSLKNAAGQVYGVYAHNKSTTWRFVQLYNTATAPAAGTAPALIVGIAPGTTRDLSFGFGVPFTTGIWYTITANAGAFDLLSVVVAGDVGVNVAYA